MANNLASSFNKSGWWTHTNGWYVFLQFIHVSSFSVFDCKKKKKIQSQYGTPTEIDDTLINLSFTPAFYVLIFQMKGFMLAISISETGWKFSIFLRSYRIHYIHIYVGYIICQELIELSTTSSTFTKHSFLWIS